MFKHCKQWSIFIWKAWKKYVLIIQKRDQKIHQISTQNQHVQDARRTRHWTAYIDKDGFFDIVWEKVIITHGINIILAGNEVCICKKKQLPSRFGPYFVEPVIAGLDKYNQPFVRGMDLIGCVNSEADFAVSGTAGPQLYGMSELLWEPNLVKTAIILFSHKFYADLT